MDCEVTVLMPIYNPNLAHLMMAVNSILVQSMKSFELLIVDDGSEESYEDIINKNFNDSRIRYIRLDRNQGLISALNCGLNTINTKYIARMDSDDVATIDRLSLQRQYLIDHPDVEVVFGWVDLVDEQNNYIGVWSDDRKYVSDVEIAQRLKRTNCVAHPTAFARSGIFKKFKYSENQKLAEDYGLWLKYVSMGYKISKIDKVLLKYRVHEGSVTITNKNIFDTYRNSRVQFKHLLNLRRIPTQYDRSLFFYVVWNFMSATKNFVLRLSTKIKVKKAA